MTGAAGPARRATFAPSEAGLRRIAALAVVAALALVAGTGFTRLFPTRDLWVLLPVAAVLPVVLVGALSRHGRPVSPALTVPVWLAGFVAWTAYTVAAGSGDLMARLDVVRTGVVDGWARVLDMGVPAPADPDLLIVALAPTWLAAALGAELAVRTRAALAPALPAAVALLAASALAVPAPGDNLARAGALAALTALFLMIRAPRAASRGPRRELARRGGATLLVVMVGVFAGTAATRAGGGDPVDPRTHRSTPPVSQTEPSPLSALGGWTAHPDEVLFHTDVSGPAPAEPVTLRLAVLDSYDGAQWRSTARFVRAGSGPPSSQAGIADDPAGDPAAGGRAADPADDGPGPAPVGEMRQVIEIAGLGGRILPSDGRLVGAPTGVRVDPGTGTLLNDRPLLPGDRYEIISVPDPRPAPADLPRFDAGTARTGGPDPDLEVPADPPAILGRLADIATARGSTPFQRAALLRQYLSATFTFDPAVPPGHSYGHIDHFLAHTHRGTSEQFATAFVLAARILGLPARLAVGFTAPPVVDGQPRTVHGADALAWAEVRFDGAGWLPFFPTPPAADARGASVAGSNPGETPEQAELIDVALRSAVETTAPATRATEDSTPAVAPPGPGAWSRWAIRSGLAITGAAALYLALAVALPSLRRGRLRRAGHPRRRVVDAWRQAVDALTDAGLPVPAAASPGEVARIAAAEVGPSGETAIRELADIVTLALFAPVTAVEWEGTPGRRAADEACRLLDRFERALRERTTLRARIRRTLAPSTVATELRRLRDARDPRDPGDPPTGAAGDPDGPRDPGTDHGRPDPGNPPAGHVSDGKRFAPAA
ncbi:DUF3488 and transglutaminase-like domain-containing protein [Frankia sp. Mgl5]|uniref:transglutaminaseTgpA domain-containing protein n=1 Tax=Frankia sp. Mgl5 TaxID=2933793 RepID=UPI002010BF98|nr:transglutaminaseTgpA domain-containing protein [Frankia sp. Mgl5]MCK9932226.1 DUF3488 and transglutaminase-like domain-containing protein [Frankia sp. Mgl5]